MHQVTSFWFLGAVGQERVTARLGREVQLCRKKFCAHTEVSGSLLTWPGCIKLDVGVLCPAQSSTVLRAESKEQSRGSRGGKGHGETWKLLRHTARKGESGTGARGRRVARGVLCFFSPCSQVCCSRSCSCSAGKGTLLLPPLDGACQSSLLKIQCLESWCSLVPIHSSRECSAPFSAIPGSPFCPRELRSVLSEETALIPGFFTALPQDVHRPVRAVEGSYQRGA